MTLEEVRRDLEAKRVQLREYRRGLAEREEQDDPIARYAATIATGRLQQIEMDIILISKVGT